MYIQKLNFLASTHTQLVDVQKKYAIIFVITGKALPQALPPPFSLTVFHIVLHSHTVYYNVLTLTCKGH